LPVGAKDLIDVSDLPNTCGSRALVDWVPERSDALIDRIEERGAVIAGKTNTPEFGVGANTFNLVFGITRNAWDISRNAGGSSGGSSVALATGQLWLCHGSDLDGSLRTPASFASVVGLRPSPGRAGGGPAAAAFMPEAVNGPMARDVGDVALFLDAMCGCDPRHPLSIEEPAESFQSALGRNPGAVWIAFAEGQGGFAPVEREIRAVLRRAIETAAGSGVEVEETCPDLPGLIGSGGAVVRRRVASTPLSLSRSSAPADWRGAEPVVRAVHTARSRCGGEGSIFASLCAVTCPMW